MMSYFLILNPHRVKEFLKVNEPLLRALIKEKNFWTCFTIFPTRSTTAELIINTYNIFEGYKRC